MKHDSSAASWLKFFSTAGIPKEFSETYAVTFSKNQINLDMLPEIKKEYLVDMGISLMGHIIAILRHAKAVHDEAVKKTALSNGNKAVPKETPTVKFSPVTVKKDSNEDNSKVRAKPVVKSQLTKPQVATPKATAPQKRSLDDTISEKPAKMVKTVHLKATDAPKLKNDEIEKKKVFARLGSDVSSAVSNGESVFSRLGGKTIEPTVIRTPVIKQPLQKNTIKQKTTVEIRKPENIIRLNGTSRLTPKVPTIVKGTMRADETERKISKTTTIKSNVVKTNIRARLGNTNKVRLSTGSVKHVTFGGVTKKVIPRVKTNINQLNRTNAAMDMVNRGSLGVTGVFSRLGI